MTTEEEKTENFGGGGYAGHSGIIGLTDWSLYPYMAYVNNDEQINNYQNYLDSQKQVIIEKYKRRNKRVKHINKYVFIVIAFILSVFMINKLFFA